MKSDTRVLVIGGGAMGVSLLYHLAKAGWSDIVLTEKNDLTHGSTWHAAGLCTHFAHNPTIQQLRARSIRLYRDVLPAETGRSCGFHACGAMRITGSAARMDEFAHVAGLSKFTGCRLKLLTAKEISTLHPLTRMDGLIGGIFEADDGHVDPSMAVAAMAEAAQAEGATILRRNRALSVRRERGRWLIETEKGLIRAEHVVNAAGTWAREVGAMMGTSVPCIPMLHQYIVFDGVPEVAARSAAGLAELPMIRDPDESWYVRQERDGLILGPYEKDGEAWAVDGCPEGFGADLLPPDLDRVEHIAEAAMARIPALEGGGIKSVVRGPITFTPDANPLIGPAAGAECVWLLTGSSMGVMEGGGAGWFLARWMVDGMPPLDPLAVDGRRFGAWADRDYLVEKAVECFGHQFGAHFPHEVRPAGRNRRLSPVHGRMAERGGVMGVANGWERPDWFAVKRSAEAELTFRRADWFDAVAAEVETVASAVGLMDMSPLSKFVISGPDARAFVNSLGANAAPSTGRVGLTHALTASGGTSAEFAVAMLADDRAYLTSAAAAELMDFDLLNAHSAGHDVVVDNAADRLGALGLMGPESRAVLSALTGEDLGGGFPWMSAREIKVAGIAAIAVRMSYVGELGWELHADSDDLPGLFDAIVSEGRRYGIGMFGAFAANSMRIEKGYRAWGSEFSAEIGPDEAGADFAIRPEGRGFAGKDALAKRRASGGAGRVALLRIMTDDPDPFFNHPVCCCGKPVGIVTSGCWGHRVGQALAFAYLKDGEILSGLSVEILGERYPAEILDQAPYDPSNSRLKS